MIGDTLRLLSFKVFFFLFVRVRLVLRDAANELVSHCVAVVVVVGDGHDICSAQSSRLVNARVGGERSLEKSTSIQERKELVFRNVDIRIMCEYPRAQAAGPKKYFKGFFS